MLTLHPLLISKAQWDDSLTSKFSFRLLSPISFVGSKHTCQASSISLPLKAFLLCPSLYYFYIYPLPLGHPSHSLPHLVHLGHHGAPSWAPCDMQQVPISYMAVYLCLSQSLSSSHSSSPNYIHTSILYIYVSHSALYVRSFYYFFFRFHINSFIYDICFSLSHLLHSWSFSSQTETRSTHGNYCSSFLKPFLCLIKLFFQMVNIIPTVLWAEENTDPFI